MEPRPVAACSAARLWYSVVPCAYGLHGRVDEVVVHRGPGPTRPGPPSMPTAGAGAAKVGAATPAPPRSRRCCPRSGPTASPCRSRPASSRQDADPRAVVADDGVAGDLLGEAGRDDAAAGVAVHEVAGRGERAAGGRDRAPAERDPGDAVAGDGVVGDDRALGDAVRRRRRWSGRPSSRRSRRFGPWRSGPAARRSPRCGPRRSAASSRSGRSPRRTAGCRGRR